MASRILLIEGKAIDITTQEAYQTVALEIVNARWKMGYYKQPPEPTKPEMSYNQINRLTKEEWERIKKCIEEKGEKKLYG